MRSALKRTLKSGTDKLKSGVDAVRGKERQSTTIRPSTELTAEEADERYRRKMERAQKMREDEKKRHQKEKEKQEEQEELKQRMEMGGQHAFKTERQPRVSAQNLANAEELKTQNTVKERTRADTRDSVGQAFMNDVISQRERAAEDSSEDLGSESSTVLNTFKSRGISIEQDMESKDRYNNLVNQSYKSTDTVLTKKQNSNEADQRIKESEPAENVLAKKVKSHQPVFSGSTAFDQGGHNFRTLSSGPQEEFDLSKQVPNKMTGSILEQNKMNAPEESKDSGKPLQQTMAFLEEVKGPIDSHKGREKSSSMQNSRPNEFNDRSLDQHGQKNLNTDFHKSLVRRNMTLHNSKPVDTCDDWDNNVDFDSRRESKMGNRNDQDLEKFQNEITATEARIQSLNSQTNTDQIIEFSKKVQQRKSTFVPFSDISENSRSSDASKNTQSPLPNNRREAIIKKKRSLSEDGQIDEKKESSDSATSYDSEEDIDSKNLSEASEEVFQNQLGALVDSLEEQEKKDLRLDADDFVDDLLKLNDNASEAIEDKVDDMIVLLDKSEHLFIKFAQEKLVKNKTLLEQRAREHEAKKGQERFIQQRVLNGPNFKSFGQYEPHLQKLREKQKQTCIAVSDEVIVFGTSSGALWAYNKETQKLYGRYENSDREMFEGNSVNCVHFHPLRTEYVVAGYQGGQIILLDLTENENGKLKSKKVIKDHHRGSPLVSVKFCDWIKEREASVIPQAIPDAANNAQQQQRSLMEDKQAWMIASVDIDGKIVITSITNVAFGLLSANKFVIVDPVKDQQRYPDKVFPRYQAVEPRFFDKIFPQGFYNDSQTWLALASKEEVQILQVAKESCRSCFGLKRPKFYPSERLQGYATFPETIPVIAWGYGRTPVFKHRTYALMAVAWGPLIQIVLLVPDDEKNGEGNDFRVDGQYFIAPGTVQDAIPGTSYVVDVQVQSMSFLSESILLVYTSTQDIRVLYTQSFFNGQYQSPSYEQALVAPNFEEIDSRLKLMDVGSAFTKQQLQIELERKKFLQEPVQKSEYGLRAGQTLSTHQDWIVFLTEKGVYMANHLTWQESLELDSDDMQSTWIETFQRVIDIFEGKIKGFKGTVDDRELRQEFMKAELKQLVTALIEKVILQWQSRAAKMSQTGTAAETIHEDLQEKYRTLIKRTIELCVDIWEPFFLFNELFQKFVEQRMSSLFSEELQPYILAGTFSDTDVPEEILDNHILKHPFLAYTEAKMQTNDSPPSGVNPGQIRQSPAENFEKILVNTSFNLCSDRYIGKMIEFCRENRLSTGLFYLCINTQGEQGTAVALCELRNFYQQIKDEENKDEENCIERKIYTSQDLLDLENMPANFHQREPLEKSSVYVGYKLLWVIRLLLLGKRFPKGHFEQNIWHDITHEVLNIITQVDFMKTLFEIDASAFFQIITIVFNNPSKQYDFLIKGRPVSRKSGAGVVKIQMTHSEIVKRISDFCMELKEGDDVRLQYLFFIASIAGENQELRDADFYYKVTQELLKNNREYLFFNKNLLNRQMTNKQLYRKLSRKGFNAPDKVKHIILSEENIMKLLLKCEPLQKEMVDELVEQIKDTDFNSLKLILYEKQEDYIKCLKLLVETESASSFVTIKMQDRFAWILEKFMMLERRIQDRSENTTQRYQFELFEKEILQNAVTLVKIDAHKTVGLADALFDGNHLEFLDRMAKHPQERFDYVCKLLELQSEQCKEAIQAYTLQMTADPKKAQIWQKVLRLHLELACQLKPEMVIDIIRNATKENYYPMEEYLKICEQQNQTEACALLCEQIGAYREAVQHYLELLEQKLNVRAFQKELQEFDKYIRKQLLRQKRALDKQRAEELEKQQRQMRDQQQIQSLDVSEFAQLNTNIEQLMQKNTGANIPNDFTRDMSLEDRFKEALQQKLYLEASCLIREQNAPNIELVERVLKTIINIFTTQPDEVIKSNNQVWQNILHFLFSLYHRPELRKKRSARRFITQKLVSVAREMLRHISLRQLLDGTLMIHETMRFKGIKQLTSEVFWDKRAEVDLTQSATRITKEENKNLEETMFQSKGVGLLYRYTRCDLCRRNVNTTSLMSNYSSIVSDYDPKHDSLIIFECPGDFNHVFHHRCLDKAIKDELRKDKKAGVKEADVAKSRRCMECYKQSQDISEALVQSQKSTSRVPSRKNPSRSGMHTPRSQMTTRRSNPSETASVGHSDYGAQEGSDTASNGRYSRVQKTLKELRFEKMGKKMDMFDDNLNFDTLELGNFKKHV